MLTLAIANYILCVFVGVSFFADGAQSPSQKGFALPEMIGQSISETFLLKVLIGGISTHAP